MSHEEQPGSEPTTGDADVDAAMERLASLDDAGPAQAVEVLESVHHDLVALLARTED